jgi:UDP-N-acetyl-D-mannosaminuronic acid dehydrogenase
VSLDDLRAKITNKSAKIGVVGLGYVGLAVACKFAEVGFAVSGVDIVAERVDLINRGLMPIQGKEPDMPELLQQVVANNRLHAYPSAEALTDTDVVIIAVETPVEIGSKRPKYVALRSAVSAVGKVMSRGALVIVESTIAPGTIARVVRPLLDEVSGLRVNEDYFLGHCPERVMPGRLLGNLTAMSRVCGGGTLETSEVMVALYRNFVKADLDRADWVTAEMVKTTENAYRDVEIAFANELAMICEAVGADVWKVRELVNKSPGRNIHLPGAGVGGHCIPKDPWLLISAMSEEGFSPQLIPAARHVNETMPLHMANLVESALQEAGGELRGARVAVLGYAYLENSDDTRNSPSQALIDRLQEQGAQVIVHDPYVPEYKLDLVKAVNDADALVIMVRHDEYLALQLADLKAQLKRPILIDGRRVFEPAQARQAGFIFRGVGRGEYAG